ncbi:MAG: ABC transporter permease subunit [Gemmatimonadetes bacterium]|nr:ABC transporter permease subunit [Gemmatimonadota bacterium]
MTTRVLRIALFVFLLVAAIAPLAFLMLVSMGVDWFYPALIPPALDLAPWRDLASVSGGGQRLARATASSLFLAIATGALAAALALPVGRALARLRGWRRSLGAAAAFLPVAAPPIALGVGLQYSLLSLGVGGTHSGVLLAHLVPAVGYTSLFFLGIFSIYDFSVEEEARTLGASGYQRALRVTLPLMRRPLMESFALGFLVSWAQVPLTLLVGQGIVTTLAVEVLSFVQSGQDRLAATGAILLIVPALLMLALVGVAIRRAGVV